MLGLFVVCSLLIGTQAGNFCCFPNQWEGYTTGAVGFVNNTPPDAILVSQNRHTLSCKIYFNNNKLKTKNR
jgi:hypothetical protein